MRRSFFKLGVLQMRGRGHVLSESGFYQSMHDQDVEELSALMEKLYDLTGARMGDNLLQRPLASS